MNRDLDTLRGTARHLFEAGDYYGAAFALRSLLGRAPQDAGAALLMGLALKADGRGEEAVAYLRRASGGDPGTALAALEALEGLLPESEGQVATEPAPGDRPRLVTLIDYSIQPYNLGDLLVYLMGSLVAAEEAGAPKIDYWLLSDPTRRPPQDPNMRSLVNAGNHHFHLMSIMPVLELNPILGSVHLVDSLEETNRLVSLGTEGMVFWPTLEQLRAEKYMFYDIFKLVGAFHRKGRALPRLRFNPVLAGWATRFFERHVLPAVPVSVNLRNNPYFHTHRNSNMAAWKAFFRSVEGRVPVKFIVTCAASEVDKDLQALPNVVFAKEEYSTALQDLALIHFSAFHLGAPSGPAALPIFETKPYHIFHCDMLPHLAHYGGSLLQNAAGELQYSFAEPLQSFGVVPESAMEIERQFDRIWNSRDWPTMWRAQGAPEAQDVPTWMV